MRPQFKKAWEEVNTFVNTMIEGKETDDAALITAMLRHCAYVFVVMSRMVNSDLTAKEMFMFYCNEAFEDIDAQWKLCPEIEKKTRLKVFLNKRGLPSAESVGNDI